jgi:hypothetical protein
MTTDPRIIVSPNVYHQNDGIVFPLPEGEHRDLSAISMVAQARPNLKTARLGCLLWATDLVSSALPTYKLWLLACQTVWQPDTRVVRFGGLWKWFERAGIPLPNGKRSSEVVRVMNDKFRSFGWIEIEQQELFSTDVVLRAEHATMLVATMGDPPDLESYLKAGWATVSPSTMAFWAEMSQVAAEHEGLFLRPFGSFDDREAGVNIIGDSKVIDQLASAAQSHV